MRRLIPFLLFLVTTTVLPAQAPGVPVIEERHGDNPAWVTAAEGLIGRDELLSVRDVRKQLERTHVELRLPRPDKRRLDGRELFAVALAAHLRVGWFYKCTRCTRWHFNLAGGYAITADGAVATCFHVVEPGDTMKEGYLIAVTVEGEVLPVSEVLASSKLTDACIVRVRSEKPMKPLALNSEIQPGDEVWCYSDPAGREGYFARGMVNRFFRHVHGDEEAPVRINVSTDWAPGSSGSAVLDVFGNAIGHVTAIDSHGGGNGPGTDDHTEKTLIVFHSAVRAADVRSLTDRPETP